MIIIEWYDLFKFYEYSSSMKRKTKIIMFQSYADVLNNLFQKAVMVNPKPLKTEKAKVVSIWKNMTVQELADVIGRDLGMP